MASLVVGAGLLLAACGGATESTPAPAATTAATTATQAAAASTNTATATATGAATGTAAATQATGTAAASPTATSAPATSAPATTAPSSGNPGSAEEWFKSMGPALGEVKSYRMSMAMNIAEDQVIQSLEGEVVRPDTMRIKVSTPMGESVMTFIDGTMYMSVGGMVINQPADQETLDELMPSDLEDVAENWSPEGASYELGGKESVDGVECQMVTVTWTEEGETYVATYWVGVKDHLPRKMTTVVDVPATADTAAHESTLEARYFDYNADIVIEKPQ